MKKAKGSKVEKKDKKAKGDTITRVAARMGVTPEAMIEDMLKQVLIKTPMDALQKIGLVKGEPKNKNIDVEAVKRKVSREIADDMMMKTVHYRMHRISYTFPALLQYRFGLGLGAKFVTPYLWGDEGNRRYIIELTAMRKVQKRVIDAKDDAKRPAFGLEDRPGIFWKFEYERETKTLDLMEADRYGVTAREVKAFEAEMKSEAAEIAAKAAKRKTKFEAMSVMDYFNVCDAVLDYCLGDCTDKVEFVPYSLLTRGDVLRLLRLLFRAIEGQKKDMEGPRKRQFPKRFYKEEIARIRRAINICPRELVKEAEARFRKTGVVAGGKVKPAK